MTEARAISDGRLQLAADLTAAKALIDTPEKWGKGYFRTDDGCYCAAGAVIYAARPLGGRDFGREDAGIRALKAALPGGAKGVAQFNDDPKTTHVDVMALFDRAIKEASNG